MLVIRLQRTGRKNRATFRIVLQEKGQAPKSKALEILGNYHPHLKERADQIQLNTERILYWLSQGAESSNTIHNMLVETGAITEKKKRSVQPKPKPAAEGEEAPAADTKKEEASESVESVAPEEAKEDAKKEETEKTE